MKTLKTADLFDELQPEKEQDVKKSKVERNPRLEKIIEGFERFLKSIPNDSDLPPAYSIAQQAIPKIYTSQDVAELSLQLLHGEKNINYSSRRFFTGIYLSALINHCPQKELVICTPYHDTFGLHHLGFKNKTKHVLVKGNGGYAIGTEMSGGKITVEGNVTQNAGLFMKNGTIHIKGNCDVQAGKNMENGMIIIDGNAAELVGQNSCGGKIYIGGTYKSISDNCSADVYTKTPQGTWKRVWNGETHE